MLGITVLAKPWVAALYDGEGSIDRVIPLEGAPGARDWAAKWKLARQLRRERFDLAILFPNSFESAAMVWLAAAKRIMGYARDGRAAFLSDAIAPPEKGEIPPHECFYYLEMLRRAGLIESIPDVPDIRLDRYSGSALPGRKTVREIWRKAARDWSEPGAAYGAAKRWLPERFGEAAGAPGGGHRWFSRGIRLPCGEADVR